MAVDRAWLEKVRRKNRAAFGMPSRDAGVPMSGLGARQERPSSQDVVTALDIQRGVRTQQIHAGRFEKSDPTKPTEGSVESIAESLQIPEAALPAAQPLPRPVVWLGAVATVGVLGLLAYAIYRRA